jgi:hypothetical protein
MRLGLTVGVRVLVCMNMAFHGDFQPLLAKHSKSFSLVDAISVGVDRMQRNFEPMRRQVETWRAQQLTSATAKLIIYRAFIEDELDAPKHLARRVHEMYFAPQHEDFQPRTMWSLSNAFTSAFKELDPIPQFKATAKLGPYLERVLGWFVLIDRSGTAAKCTPFALLRSHFGKAPDQIEPLRNLALIAAHSQFPAVLQQNEMIAVKPWLDLLYELDIDCSGPMNP